MFNVLAYRPMGVHAAMLCALVVFEDGRAS